jgi:hypothetical protein
MSLLPRIHPRRGPDHCARSPVLDAAPPVVRPRPRRLDFLGVVVRPRRTSLPAAHRVAAAGRRSRGAGHARPNEPPQQEEAGNSADDDADDGASADAAVAGVCDHWGRCDRHGRLLPRQDWRGWEGGGTRPRREGDHDGGWECNVLRSIVVWRSAYASIRPANKLGLEPELREVWRQMRKGAALSVRH